MQYWHTVYKTKKWDSLKKKEMKIRDTSQGKVSKNLDINTGLACSVQFLVEAFKILPNKYLQRVT